MCLWYTFLIEHVITNKITYSAICTVFLLEIGKKDLYLCNTRGYNRTKLQANMANCKQYRNHSVQKWPRKSRRGLWNPRSLRCLTTQKYSVHFARSNRNANWTSWMWRHCCTAFTALTLLVGRLGRHPTCKNPASQSTEILLRNTFGDLA